MTSQSKKIGTGAHIAHMIICACTLGFVFPNAFVENMDNVVYVANDDVGKKAPAKKT